MFLSTNNIPLSESMSKRTRPKSSAVTGNYSQMTTKTKKDNPSKLFSLSPVVPKFNQKSI